MYLVFARRYRPERFEDVVGQQHVTRALRNAVESGRVAHAYLFCGSRGVGKTTVARILAKALNCAEGPTPEPCCECDACRRIAVGTDIDVIEIDGASNRGIDAIRELRQNAGLTAARSRFKVYYIDEVHMLTEPAFNALLKTLEEPPPHVKFIFSTTDPQKVPETVRSRCQRFDFHRISDADLVGALEDICRTEELTVEEGGLKAIARSARGSLRDALGVLDQLAAMGREVTLEDVLHVLGAADARLLAELVDVLAEEDTARALELLDGALVGGTSVEDFAEQFARYLRDLLVAAYCGPEADALAGAAADAETLARQSGMFSADQLTYMMQLLREAALRARRETTGRIALELAVVRMSRLSELVPVQEALEALEGGGNPRTSAEPKAKGAPSAEERRRGAGPLRRMKDKLQRAKPGDPSPSAATAAPEVELPDGVDERKARQLAACAESPEVARSALQEEPLMQAFIQADKTLGLSPQLLRKRAEQQAEDEDATPPEQQ